MPLSWMVSIARHFLPTLQSGPLLPPSRSGLINGSRLPGAFACLTGILAAALVVGFATAFFALVAGIDGFVVIGFAAVTGFACGATGFGCVAVGAAAAGALFAGAALVMGAFELSGATFWLGGTLCATAGKPEIKH